VGNKGLNKKLTLLVDSLSGLSREGIHLDSLTSLKSKINAYKKNPTDIQLASQIELSSTKLAIQAGNILLYGTQHYDSTVDYHNSVDSINVWTMLHSKINSDSLNYFFQSCRPRLSQYSSLLKMYQILLDSTKDWQKIDPTQISSIRKRLAAEIGIPMDTISNTTDSLFKSAIQTYQYRHDLKITGNLDSTTLKWLKYSRQEKCNHIGRNLDRLRWLVSKLPQEYIWVNIPAMQLEYYQNDTLAYKMKAVVGRTSRKTPTLNAYLQDIVFNPPWNVPETIMKEEIIPGVKRKGGNYLARRGLKAFRGGREVNPSLITEKNFKAFVISQKPGLNSSLGAIKFNMPNRHAIYLHDTPHREDFKKQYRAYSSGCIRVHHPREFAEILLKDTNFSRPKIDSMIKNKITRSKVLNRKIPVHIVYITNHIDSAGNLIYLRDIYGYDQHLINYL
jgi:murein L,D-transpeptidase YcbB/YkuD